MQTGVQFVGALAANQTQRWFTFGWPADAHVVWYMMPTTQQGTPEVTWSVAVQRDTPTTCWYWITVNNLTAAPVDFEGRYAIL